jgi:hypothetical protein
MKKINIGHKIKWVITKYANERDYKENKPFEQREINGNILLNVGIDLLEDILTGASTAVFDNTNARIGVGDGTTAEDATQTGLQGTNTAYLSMDTGYPSRSGETLTFQAVADDTTANFSWQEFCIDNGTTALNRKVSDQGTKASGQIWTVKVTLTFS